MAVMCAFVRDDLADPECSRRLERFAVGEGFGLGVTVHAHSTDPTADFKRFVDEVRRYQCTHVVLPSREHLQGISRTQIAAVQRSGVWFWYEDRDAYLTPDKSEDVEGDQG